MKWRQNISAIAIIIFENRSLGCLNELCCKTFVNIINCRCIIYNTAESYSHLSPNICSKLTFECFICVLCIFRPSADAPELIISFFEWIKTPFDVLKDISPFSKFMRNIINSHAFWSIKIVAIPICILFEGKKSVFQDFLTKDSKPFDDVCQKPPPVFQCHSLDEIATQRMRNLVRKKERYFRNDPNRAQMRFGRKKKDSFAYKISIVIKKSGKVKVEGLVLMNMKIYHNRKSIPSAQVTRALRFC